MPSNAQRLVLWVLLVTLLLGGSTAFSRPHSELSELFPLFQVPFEKERPLRSERQFRFLTHEWQALRERILNDHDHRIADTFAVDPAMRKRIAFWFDIYSRYGEAHHIIHHVRYPWIVF